MSTVKATNIQEPNSATVNMVLNTSGAVAVGQNLSVAGTTTLTGSLASTLNLVAGTTTVAPLDFATGTNLTTAIAGGMEYDGKVFYGTPQSTQRGVIPGMQFFQVNSSIAGANVATAQSVFGVSVTLSASTVYAFEAIYYLNKTAGATSHTIGFGFGGTATINSTFWNAIGFDTQTAIQMVVSNSLANITWAGGNAAAAVSAFANVKGTVSINGGGTFTPQYTLSAAPGGAYSTMANSYFLIYPIGASGANVNVGTWA